MRTVPYPIHEAQRRIIKKFSSRYPQQHEGTADATASRSRRPDLACDAAHPRKRKHRTKRPEKVRMNHRTRDMQSCSRPHEKLNTLNGNVWTELCDMAADRAVAASDIQNGSTLRNLRRSISARTRCGVRNKRMCQRRSRKAARRAAVWRPFIQVVVACRCRG